MSGEVLTQADAVPDAVTPGAKRVLAWAPALFAVLSVVLLTGDGHVGLVPASWFGLVTTVVCVVAVTRGLPGGFWTLPHVCLLVLCTFHMGALIDFIRTDSSTFLSVMRLRMMPETGTAVLLSTLGISCFSAATLMGWRPDDRADVTHVADSARDAMADVGALFSLVGCAGWFMFARAANLSFGSTYADYLAKTPGTAVALLYTLLTLGLPLAMVRYRRLLPRVSLVGYLLFALIAFPLGLRGEVLFGGVIAAAVVGMQRKMPSWRTMAILIVVLLVSITVVSQTRQGGEGASVTRDPLQALNEMGGTLYVVAETVSWHDTGEEPFQHGVTFWAPVRDSLKRFVLREKDYDPSQDMDYMATQVISRIGFFGGSIIGEAYINFAAPGVVLILGGFGFVIAFTNSRARSSNGRLFVAIMAAVIFQQLVRNASESMPVTLLLGLVMWVAAKGLALLRPGKT